MLNKFTKHLTLFIPSLHHKLAPTTLKFVASSFPKNQTFFSRASQRSIFIEGKFHKMEASLSLHLLSRISFGPLSFPPPPPFANLLRYRSPPLRPLERVSAVGDCQPRNLYCRKFSGIGRYGPDLYKIVKCALYNEQNHKLPFRRRRRGRKEEGEFYSGNRIVDRYTCLGFIDLLWTLARPGSLGRF